MENDRNNTTSKMYPIDLAPQKITIVKTGSNAEVKMAHLITGQPKTSATGPIIHAASVGLMRPAAQIISSSVASQPQMIVSGSPILQSTQIVSQGSQIVGQSSQILSQSQLISPTGQMLTQATQIISQGSQLTAQGSTPNNTAACSIQASIPSSLSGTQVLNVGGLVSGPGNLVVSSSVRTLPPSVRVLPPLPHSRPAVQSVQLSTVTVSSSSGVLLNKSITSHVPRGLAAGASLAVRPVTPASATQSVGNQAGAWGGGARGVRGAVVYGPRARPPRPPPPAHPLPAHPHAAHCTVISMPTSTVLTTSSIITGAVRGAVPRPTTPTPVAATASRPLPLLQRNYQPKVVGVSTVGVRAAVGNSAPAHLYYEVPRPAPAPAAPAHHLLTRPLTPYAHLHQAQPVNVGNTIQTISESRPSMTSLANTSMLPRPTILRKRDIEGSPSKASVASVGGVTSVGGVAGVSSVGGVTGVSSVAGNGLWARRMSEERAGGSGSTTESAGSSPRDDDRLDADLSPRKKPRKQILNNEVRHCDFPAEEPPPSPPPPPINPPPKRPQLGSSYVCEWRATALHFARPADVRRREGRARDILAIAAQKHVLSSADGWKVHHLTAQMDDLVSLEADVGGQLASVLRTLENSGGRSNSPLQPHLHTLLELVKGNIQRSKIVCEGIQEARDDILRVFTHRNVVSEILQRQADKRCFRKHRIQS